MTVDKNARQAFRDTADDGCILGTGAHERDRLGDHLIGRDPLLLQPECSCFQLRAIHDRRNEPQQPLGAGADRADASFLLCIELTVHTPEQHV